MSASWFSNRNDAKLLLLGTEENINLYRVYITFYALINSFRKLLDFFCATFRHVKAEPLDGRWFLEKCGPKI